jgi:DNA-cytosine methyltransferase
MKYGSVCSGIEAASVAWHDLGWEPQWFSEIEQFPSEVLKHRFPDVPNLGDMTQLTQNPTFNERSIDLLVGGTPCQSFSVAGLRKGLADPRGNLMLTFLALADAKKPKWIVWENVPGVLSSNGGRDFGTFLGALGELGYGFAYRVLDAQHFGVAQRRRRVFVVGYLGDWRVAAAVLFERESLQGNTKPSRKKREEVTSDAEGSVGEAGQVVIDRAAFNQGENAQYEPRIETGETMSSLVAKGPHAVAQPIAFEPGKMQRLGYGYSDNGTSPTLRSEPGDNQLAVAQPIAIQDIRPIKKAQNGRGWNDDGTSYTVDTKATQGVAQPIAFDTFNQTTSNINQTIKSPQGGVNESIGVVAQPIAFKVRGACEGGGKGYLGQEEQAFTISATQDQQIAQPLYYESHPNDSRVNGPKDVADTVSARYGTGGGNTPLVQQPIAVDVYNQKTTGDKFGVVREQHGTNMNAVLQPIAVDWRTAQVDQGITQTLKTDLAKMSGPCIAVDTYNYTTNDHTTQTIRSQSDTEHIGAVLQPIAVDVYNQSIDGQTSATITEAVGGTNTSGPKVMHSMAIRRLTPKECERLQGFPDDWTKVPYRNKEADQCPDGPRYKACGNSMAVPVMRWIGQRIQYVENLMKEL